MYMGVHTKSKLQKFPNGDPKCVICRDHDEEHDIQ